MLASKKELIKTLFVALGNEPEYLHGFTGFRDTLIKFNIKSIDHEFREVPGENHSSINIPVFHLGLKKVWKDSAALQVFEKGIKLYPSSANTYDSFAEALEKAGQLKKAKETLEVGVRLAVEGGDPELTRVIKENLQRISQKLEGQN